MRQTENFRPAWQHMNCHMSAEVCHQPAPVHAWVQLSLQGPAIAKRSRRTAATCAGSTRAATPPSTCSTGAVVTHTALPPVAWPDHSSTHVVAWPEYSRAGHGAPGPPLSSAIARQLPLHVPCSAPSFCPPRSLRRLHFLNFFVSYVLQHRCEVVCRVGWGQCVEGARMARVWGLKTRADGVREGAEEWPRCAPCWHWCVLEGVNLLPPPLRARELCCVLQG